MWLEATKAARNWPFRLEGRLLACAPAAAAHSSPVRPVNKSLARPPTTVELSENREGEENNRRQSVHALSQLYD